MPTLSRKLKFAEVSAEWDRIADALRAIGVPANWMCLLDVSIESLVCRILDRAKKLGIQVELLTIQPVELEDWLPQLFECEVLFFCPDDSQAVLFRTMML